MVDFDLTCDLSGCLLIYIHIFNPKNKLWRYFYFAPVLAIALTTPRQMLFVLFFSWKMCCDFTQVKCKYVICITCLKFFYPTDLCCIALIKKKKKILIDYLQFPGLVEFDC